jgi:glycosyltransferase involved in cell wall biosynthesis
LAAKIIGQQKKNICFKILGTGPMKEEWEALSNELGCENVEFTGYLAYPKMAAYLHRSDLLINSFVKGAPQSIVNKVGDYLASGRPMINTLENTEFQTMVSQYGFGCNIAPEQTDLLADTILSYEKDTTKCAQQGKAARTTAETEFDRKVSYLKILQLVQEVMEAKKSCR